jgi:hypothetical protein
VPPPAFAATLMENLFEILKDRHDAVNQTKSQVPEIARKIGAFLR